MKQINILLISMRQIWSDVKITFRILQGIHRIQIKRMFTNLRQKRKGGHHGYIQYRRNGNRFYPR